MLLMQTGCSAIANLCQQLPADALRAEHEALLASLIPNLSHQHSRVRVSTLAALDTLVNKVILTQSSLQSGLKLLFQLDTVFLANTHDSSSQHSHVCCCAVT